MNERVVKFRVGVTVIACAILAGILILMFGDVPSVSWNHYYVNIHFEDAPGVTKGTPVRKSGLTIGRVEHIELADKGGVNVRVKIDGNVKLYEGEVPQVSGSLLGGDVVIQFVRPHRPASRPAESDASGQPRSAVQQVAYQPPNEKLITPDEWINGTVAPDPFRALGNLEEDLGTAIRSLGDAGKEVKELANRFNRLLGDNGDQFTRIVDKTEKTLDSLNRSLVGAEDIFGDEQVRANLKQTITDMPKVLSDARSALNSVNGTVSSMERNMRNLEDLTKPLAEHGDEIVTNADQAIRRLDEMLANLSTFTRELNSGQGSLGKLMRDPELYQNLNRAAINLQEITRDVKPILADVRVFSDKVARQPSVLLQGALQKPGPPIK